MHAAYEVPRISVTNTPLAGTDTDLIIIPIAEDAVDEVLARLDAALADEVRSAVQRGEFRGKAYETFAARTPAPGWRASRVVFVGGGARRDIGAERLRRMVTSAARVAHHQKRSRIAWADLEPGTLAGPARAEIVADGIVLSNFDNGVHRSSSARPSSSRPRTPVKRRRPDSRSARRSTPHGY
jgi:leucyl aminopeptidase